MQCQLREECASSGMNLLLATSSGGVRVFFYFRGIEKSGCRWQILLSVSARIDYV